MSRLWVWSTTKATMASGKRWIVDSQIWSVPQLADNLLVMLLIINEMRRAEREPRLELVEGMN